MADRAPRPRIRARWTAWYAGSLLAVLLVAVAAVRVLLGRALTEQFARSQVATAELATRFFRTEIAEFRTVEATLAHMGRELVPGEHVLEFVRPDGRVFPGDPAAAHPLPALPPPVRTLVVPLDRGLAPGWQVHVHTSAAALVALERRLDRGVALAVVLVGVTALALGWWIAGRMLRPVAEMAEAAAGVTAATSDRRLPIDNPDDELGRLGLRFNALLDRLDGALGAERRFLSDAAHELRTPIARMRGRVELARLASPGDETLAQLEGDLRRTSQLVAELLELARLEGRGAGALEAGFLDDVVTDEWRAWSGEARRLGVALAMSAVEEAPVRFDPVLLPRLVGVLIDNALRYTPAGGHVDVRVTATDGRAVLEVEDDGPGIPDADRAHLTERFFRGAAARVARPDGSGLGLAIAAEIAERHGATLTFGSGNDGRGTRVIVAFPPFTAGSSSPHTLGGDDEPLPVPLPAPPLAT